MSELWIDESAENDLELIALRDQESADYIWVLIEQIGVDPDLLSRLTQEDYGVPGIDLFNIDAIEFHQNAKRNIWRLKTWNLDGQLISYRVIYAFDTKTGDYTILGVLHRNSCYDPKNRRVLEIVQAYERYGFAHI